MRSGATYRAARHAAGDRTPRHGEHPKNREGIVIGIPRLMPMVPARYRPFFCKVPRIKFGSFGDGLDAVMVPYTDLRKQPKVYG